MEQAAHTTPAEHTGSGEISAGYKERSKLRTVAIVFALFVRW